VAQWRDVHVVIGVSGGTDSMALLRAMLTIKGEFGGMGQLRVVHIDHGLRGSDSTADAQWLAHQCDLLGIPLTVCQSDVRSLATSQGDGLEAAARDQRYQQLTLVAEQTGARYVVTGHNANDQAETVLFRLLRGSGLRGLVGIRKYRPLSPSITLVRPLLGCWRKDLVSYLNSLKQPFREDRTNQDTQFKRNRIRLDLLPHLRSEYNVRIDEALLHLSEQAAVAGQFIETEAEKLLALCDLEIALQPKGAQLASHGVVLRLHTAPLEMQSEQLVCEAIRLAWRQAQLPEQAMTQKKWQQLAQLAQSAKTSTALNLPGKIQATVSDGQLVLAFL
jgi:tRNA(Ile)-lysidine synthase